MRGTIKNADATKHTYHKLHFVLTKMERVGHAGVNPVLAG